MYWANLIWSKTTRTATLHVALIHFQIYYSNHWTDRTVVATNELIILYENNNYQILKCIYETDIYRMLLILTVNLVTLRDNSRWRGEWWKAS